MQTITTPTLRPFDSQDFAAFAGVETANPKIAFIREHALIQDGPRLELVTMDENGDPTSYAATFPAAFPAEVIGNEILKAMAGVTATADIAAAFGLQQIL